MASDEYFFTKSFSWNATWSDVGYDLGIFLGSLAMGMVIYFLLNGSPFAVVTLDLDDLEEKNPNFCYSEEEAQARYGEDEGREFGDDVQICGTKVPKHRAVKFMLHSGKKVAEIFTKLSYEEKHALMTGSARLPEDIMTQSLSEYWRGSNGKTCDGCGVSEVDVQLVKCGRCDYTACSPCRADKKLGTCYCKHENFGIPYPAPHKRKFYQKGIW